MNNKKTVEKSAFLRYLRKPLLTVEKLRLRRRFLDALNCIFFQKSFISSVQWIWHLPRTILGWMIALYQKTLSPDTGWFRVFFPYGYCRFTPTCSEYGKQAIRKYGVIRGGLKTVWRILRCNPWNKGGHDHP